MKVLALLLLPLCWEGCSSEVDTYCNRTCAKTAVCTPGTDKQACIDDCKARSDSVIPIVRTAYINPLLDCITTIDCNAIDSCTETARKPLAASAACTTFCSMYMPAAMSCGLATFADQATCVDRWKIYTDDAFKAATPCLTKTCAELSSCVNNELVPP